MSKGIKAKVTIIDEETGKILIDGLEVLPHIESYKMKYNKITRKSKFAFDYEMELEAADE